MACLIQAPYPHPRQSLLSSEHTFDTTAVTSTACANSTAWGASGASTAIADSCGINAAVGARPANTCSPAVVAAKWHASRYCRLPLKLFRIRNGSVCSAPIVANCARSHSTTFACCGCRGVRWSDAGTLYTVPPTFCVEIL